MKPHELSLFPTSQAETWRYSDEDCCFNCNRVIYDMDKNADVCRLDGRIVKPWWAACKKIQPFPHGLGKVITP